MKRMLNFYDLPVGTGSRNRGGYVGFPLFFSLQKSAASSLSEICRQNESFWLQLLPLLSFDTGGMGLSGSTCCQEDVAVKAG